MLVQQLLRGPALSEADPFLETIFVLEDRIMLRSHRPGPKVILRILLRAVDATQQRLCRHGVVAEPCHLSHVAEFVFEIKKTQPSITSTKRRYSSTVSLSSTTRSTATRARSELQDADVVAVALLAGANQRGPRRMSATWRGRARYRPAAIALASGAPSGDLSDEPAARRTDRRTPLAQHPAIVGGDQLNATVSGRPTWMPTAVGVSRYAWG
ncbi:MAG: hypothetical protein R3B06_00805 [Kofleriaceae bacterium]